MASITCAIDEGPSSLLAFTVTLREIVRPGDRVCAVHFFDDQESSPLRQTVESWLATKIPGSEYSLCWEPLDDSYPETLFSAIDAVGTKLLVLGFHGETGPKKCASSRNPEILNRTLLAVFEAQLSFMTIKLAQYRAPGFTWAICLDDSKNSLRALQYTKNFIRTESDRVIVLNVARNVPERLQQDISLKHRRLFDQLNASFVQLPAPSKGAFVSEVILHYIQSREVEVHFLILGRTGRRAQLEKTSLTGSVVSHMLKWATCNILVVACGE